MTWSPLSVVLWVLASFDGVLAKREHAAENVLSDAYPFYHSSSGLWEEASSLATSCSGLRLSAEADSAVSVPVARLAALGGSERQELKVVMVFGEHARELISSETGLAWLRRLCSPEGAQIRGQTSFVMVLNANPRGRALVESGEFCTRTNENGVDLNRNYGSHWQASHAGNGEQGVGSKEGQQLEAFSSGSAAFSEPETRIIARLIKEVAPDIFLDVHSGTKGLFMPYDWTTDPLPNQGDAERMKTVLQEVSKDCPECMIGPCAETVGYLAPGSSADYAYSQGASFSYIWEIYADAADAAKDVADQKAFLARKSTSTMLLQGAALRSRARDSPTTASLESGTPSWAASEAAILEPAEQEAKQHCLVQFNPTTKADYDSTVARWTGAFATVCTAVRRIKEAS